jgi:carbon storage regulator CsrA
VKIFLQAKDESIVINGDITVTVLEINGDEVVLGIDAPGWISVEEHLGDLATSESDLATLPAR